MKYYAIQKGIVNLDQIDETLKLVGLEDAKNKKFKTFSLGMKQRLGIAFAIMDNPDFIILDEPINGLDPIGISDLRDTFKKLNEEKNITILISSHILSELYAIATKFCILEKGKIVKELTKEERLKIYEIIGEEETAELMAYYDDPEVYLKELSIGEAVDLIELMDADDAVDVLNEFEESDKEKIIELLDEEIQESVKMIESYSEDEIGSYMSDNFITISKDSTIKSAMKQMIDMAGEHDNIYTLYVTDNNKYYGAVSLRDLITARKDDSFEDLIKTGYPSFYDTDIMSECLEKIKDYSENSIPVISKDNEILGVLTTDSLVEATTDEFEEDYAKFAGLSEEEEMDESVGKSIKKRIPWLIILLFKYYKAFCRFFNKF